MLSVLALSFLLGLCGQVFDLSKVGANVEGTQWEFPRPCPALWCSPESLPGKHGSEKETWSEWEQFGCIITHPKAFSNNSVHGTLVEMWPLQPSELCKNLPSNKHKYIVMYSTGQEVQPRNFLRSTMLFKSGLFICRASSLEHMSGNIFRQATRDWQSCKLCGIPESSYTVRVLWALAISAAKMALQSHRGPYSGMESCPFPKPALLRLCSKSFRHFPYS